jgi:hypothetical protein
MLRRADPILAENTLSMTSRAIVPIDLAGLL